MIHQEKKLDLEPVGPLGIIAHPTSQKLAEQVDWYVRKWRSSVEITDALKPFYSDYKKDTYLIDVAVPRFGSGEGKGVINETIRGCDLYIVADVTNYSLTYSICGHENHYSPDDVFADIKRIIAACNGKARRINVIMPFLYGGRQHRRNSRESLDCALMLQELVNMGVENIITFDAHDPRVQNAIPLSGFETVRTTYQMIKKLLEVEDDLKIDPNHMMVISPDEGGMERAVYYANVLGVDLGMFYKRRDYTKIVGGKNPIVAHEYLGSDVSGKDMLIIDDMISSGDSMLEVAENLKKLNARNIYMFSAFGLFTNGLAKFDLAYEKGLLKRVFTTNMIYQSDNLKSKEYYASVDMSKYIASLIEALNHDGSISDLLNPYNKIVDKVNEYNEKHS